MEASKKIATPNKRFCASWADGIRHQLLYYYLASVPARPKAIGQKNKTST